MAVVCKEFKNSRDLESQDGKDTGTRVFHVFDTTTPITRQASVIALFGTATTPDPLPQRGSLWPNDVPSTPIALYARNFRVERVEDHTDVWRVTWVYTGPTPVLIDQPAPDEPGYVEFSCDTERRFEDVYRTSPVVVAGGNVNNQNITDIGGSKADIRGVPITTLLGANTFTLTEVFDTAPFQRWNVLKQHTMTRNSAPFLGAPAGKLLYIMGKIQRLDVNLYSVPHTFIEDEWFHMRQVPKLDLDGDPVLDDADPPRAKFVYWRQPFVQLTNFNNLLIPPIT